MKRIFMMALIPLIFLTGCWDQRLIKDARLVYASAFDLTEEGKVHATSVIRGFVPGTESGGTPHNDIVTGEGNSLRDTRMNMDRKLSGTFTAAKNRVFLFSNEIAEKGLYPYLDIFYRQPSSSLNSKVAITDGNAEELIRLEHKGSTLIGEFLEELILSAESNSVIPQVDVQSICPPFFDPGKDPFIPYLKLNNETDDIVVKGVALFQDDKMKGTLNARESTLLLVLINKNKKITRMVVKAKKQDKQPIDDYLTINFRKSKSKLKIIPVGGSLKASYTVNIHVNVVEYPTNNLTSRMEIETLNKMLSKSITKDLNNVIEHIQEANSDVLGIGRELMAYHPEIWKNLKWREEFPNIPITAKANVTIVENGIID